MLIVTVIATSSLMSVSNPISTALAERGGGSSDNGCGLTGQSGAATSDGRGVGEGTSQNAHNLKDQGSSEGEYVSNGAKGCSRG